jgi:hypothetical protein
MRLRSVACIAVLFGSVSVAFAQTPPPPPAPAVTPAPAYPIVRVGVVSYLQYGAELKNRQGFNNFDVTRAYLNVNAQVAEKVRFRFTPDIRRVNDGALSGSLLVRVKYAFAQFDNVTPNSWVRLGLHHTPWLDFEEHINRYRVQGTVFAEREALIPGSADFGVSYLTALPGGYGEVHGGIYNGEGFGQPEITKHKSVQGRVTVRPLPNAAIAKGLRVSAFYNAGWYAADRPRRLGIVMGSFEHTNFVATVQSVRATERPLAADVTDTKRSGWSVFLEPRQGTAGFAGLFRYDAFDADRSITANEHSRIIGGGAYWWVWTRATVGLVVTNEQVRYDVPTRPDESRLLVQTHFEF